MAYFFFIFWGKIIDLSGFIGDETVNTDVISCLVAVSYEPADVTSLVNGHQIVVGWRVEWHADILGPYKFSCGFVIAGNKDVISSQAFFAFGCKIESHSIGHHEWIILNVCRNAYTFKAYGRTPIFS